MIVLMHVLEVLICSYVCRSEFPTSFHTRSQGLVLAAVALCWYCAAFLCGQSSEHGAVQEAYTAFTFNWHSEV